MNQTHERIVGFQHAAAVVWADTQTMKRGDYQSLAIASNETGALEFYSDCPERFRPEIREAHARWNARRMEAQAKRLEIERSAEAFRLKMQARAA